MANFKKPLQTIVMNTEADWPLLFYTVDAKGNYNLIETLDAQTLAGGLRTAHVEDAAGGYNPAGPTLADQDAAGAGTAIVATDSARMRLSNYADFNRNTVSKVVKTKGIVGQPQISTVTYVVTTATAGDEVVLPLYIESDNTEAEMASGANYLYTFRRPRYYSVFVAAGETATTLAVKIRDAINADQYKTQVSLTATASAGVVTITARGNGLRFYLATDNLSGTSYGSAITSGRISQTFAVTQVAYEGRGTYQQLKTVRLQTENNIYPYSPDLNQQPSLTNLYSTYRITQNVTRPDLGGTDSANQIPVGTFEYLLYVNQTGASTAITKLDAWFNANATVKQDYPATTAAAAVVPEVVGATLT